MRICKMIFHLFVSEPQYIEKIRKFPTINIKLNFMCSQSVKLTQWNRVLVGKLIVRSDSQIPCVFWNPVFHYCFHKSLPTVLSLSQVNQSTPVSFVLLWPILTLCHHLRLGLSSGFFPSGFSGEISYILLISTMPTAWPTSRILIDVSI